MKQTSLLLVFLSAALFNGCTGPRRGASGEASRGALKVRVTSLQGMQGSYSDARIYVDDRFVGNYVVDDTVLELPSGRHVVRLEVPRVYNRRLNTDGSTVIRVYTLKGEERIEVLGGGSRQSVVFNSENVKSEEIIDEEEP